MDITPRKRAKILTLHEHTTISQQEISNAVGVNKSSVNRIIMLHNETGHVETKRKGKCGRKRKTTTRDDSFIMRKSKADPRKSSDDLKRDLAEAGVHISSSAVPRRLTEQG